MYQSTLTITGGTIKGGKVLSGTVTGNAVVGGGEFKTYTISENAQFYGGTLQRNLAGSVKLCWNANSNSIDSSCTATIGSGVNISGAVAVWGNAKLTGGSVSGSVKVYGNAQIKGGNISGGSVYGDAQIQAGTISGSPSIYGNAQILSVSNKYLYVKAGKYSSWASCGGSAEWWGGCYSQWIDRHWTDCAASGTFSFSSTISGNAVIGGGKIYGGNIGGTVSICKNNPSCNVRISNGLVLVFSAGGGGSASYGPWCSCSCKGYTKGSCKNNGMGTISLSSDSYDSGDPCKGTCVIP